MGKCTTILQYLLAGSVACQTDYVNEALSRKGLNDRNHNMDMNRSQRQNDMIEKFYVFKREMRLQFVERHLNMDDDIEKIFLSATVSALILAPFGLH